MWLRRCPILSFGWNCEVSNLSMCPNNLHFVGWERYASLDVFVVARWWLGLCDLGGCSTTVDAHITWWMQMEVPPKDFLAFAFAIN